MREIYESLFYHGIYRENIYYESAYWGHLSAIRGKQYFDLPFLSREEEEIFIDGGCYDGRTTIQFKNWAEGSFKKSIAFECDERNIEVIKRNWEGTAGKEDFILYEKGLHSSKAELHFYEDTASSGSRLSKDGGVIVPVDSIDNILNGEKATFIKMDIEGAELEALKGAERTIKKWRPKLAISLYHKPEDIYEIPLYLMKIMPEYKFYIRHYSASMVETVLYAF